MPSKKNHFKQSIYQVATHNRDGSYETQMQRKSSLMQMADQLHASGFRLSHVKGLKRKHIVSLNEGWRKEGINVRTIANRNSFLRWLCGKIDKRNIVPNNRELGVVRQKKVVKKSKAVELKDIDFAKVTDKNIYVQLHLQRYLGLRREESCKIKPHLADKGDHIHLSKSWCKGGKERDVPITTKEARYWLEEAKRLIKDKSASMIPPDKLYIQHCRRYNEQTRRSGDFKGHGLRHAYVQERYKKLTGWECPAKGGPTYKQLTKEQKEIDRKVRLQLSRQLGHVRSRITENYL